MGWETLVGIGLLFLLALYWVLLFRTALVKPRTPPLIEKTDSEYSLRSVLATSGPDCETALLWQTQVFALERLRDAGTDGLSLESARALYLHFSNYYPELCDGSDFNEWIAALQDAGVITRRDGRIWVTEKGLFILDFVDQQTGAKTGSG